MEQELLTPPEHLSSPPVFSGGRVTRPLVYAYVLIVVLVPFLFAIVLSVLLGFTVSDYPFGIFKIFLRSSALYCRNNIKHITSLSGRINILCINFKIEKKISPPGIINGL